MTSLISMHKSWWKILCVILLIYTFTAGLLMNVPRLPALSETIRNIYFAYMVLRDSIPDIDKRARISAVYNIFAYALLFPTIWIIPRLLPSLHPGGENGNPALNFKDIDDSMRLVFYPAVIGWTLLGV